MAPGTIHRHEADMPSVRTKSRRGVYVLTRDAVLPPVPRRADRLAVRIGVASVHRGSLMRSFELPPTSMPRVMRFTPDGQALAYIDTIGGVGNIRQQPLAG